MIKNMLDIILIEDNDADRELALFALEEDNLSKRVKVLKDGEEAVNYIFWKGAYSDCGICERPALIILDLRLPKINGLEILKKIRSNELTKEIPVIVFTSSHLDQDRIESYSLGANSYVTKPFKDNEFAETIAKIALYWTKTNEPPSCHINLTSL